MAFTNFEDAQNKLQCEDSIRNLTDMYVANNGSISNGVALFKTQDLSVLVEDGIYVLNSNNAIFRTVNGIVEILQEGV